MRAVILLVMLAACNRDAPVELTHREFPGFGLSVPAAMIDRTTEYRDGESVLQLGTTGFFVTWGFGTASGPEEIRQVASSMAAMLPEGTSLVPGPARTVKVGGHDAQRIDGAVGELLLAFVDVGCGARSIQISMVSARSVEPTFTNMLASFDCHPDPVAEKALASGVLIAFDDPKELAGWSRMENPDAFAITDGETMLMFTNVPPASTVPDMLAKVVTPMFAAMHGAWTAEGRETHDGRVFQLGVVSLDGDTMSCAVTGWSCQPFVQQGLLALSMSTADRREAAIAKLGKARCPRPGEKPAELPVIPLPK